MAELVNPYDSDNFIAGGGLWDGKTVTITSVVAKREIMKRGDGTPVLDNQTGEPIIKNNLEIRGIADGEENERYEQYSIGSMIPTADGNGFTKADGTPSPVHKSAEAAKFFDGVKAGGFNVGLLWDAATGKSSLSALVGARFVFRAEAKLDKDGKAKKNNKGYDQNRFIPSKFVGFSQTVKAGNGTINAGVADALKAKATETVLAVLAGAENHTVTRVELVRKVGAALAGDADSSKIIALVTRDEFHKDQSWKRDGASYSL